MARSLSGMSSLWRGEDHLVYVRGSGFLIPFREDYKRYRFQDIQLISIAKKSRIGAAILYVMAMGFCAIPPILIFALLDDLSLVAAVFAAIFLIGVLLFLGLLIRHLILGPVCTCDIQTEFSRDRIRPLDRYFQAKELLADLEPAIRKSQENLAGESVELEVSMEVQSAEPNSASQISVPHLAVPTFLVTIIFALGAIAAIHLESVLLCGVLFFLLLALGLLLLTNLISSVRRVTPQSIRTVSWVLLGLLFLFIGFAVVYLLVAVTRDPAYTLGITGPLEAFAAVATEGGLVFYLSALLLSLGLFSTGVVGMLEAVKWRGRIAADARLENSPEGGTDG